MPAGAFRGQPSLATALRPRWSCKRGDSKHPSCCALGTFPQWKVPHRRVLQVRTRRRAGICFAYLGRTVHCQQERGNFQNPQFQPHILFLTRQKENVPLTVQEKNRIGARGPQDPEKRGSAPRNTLCTRYLCRLNIVALCWHSAPRYISPIHNKKAPKRVLFFLFSAIMTTKCSRW